MIIANNIFKDIGDDGVDGFGSANKILAGNIFLRIGDLYTLNWTPGASVLDVDNLKL